MIDGRVKVTGKPSEYFSLTPCTENESPAPTKMIVLTLLSYFRLLSH